MLQRIKKVVRRRIRYHWLTECLQYRVRNDLHLKISAINLELEVKPGDVMIDCGANVGDVTSLLARSGATIYAFEPNPLCFSILSKRFRAMPTVHCVNQGVMDRQCTLVLSTPNPHGQWDAVDTTVSASFVGGAMASDDYLVQQADIECIDLAQFIRSLGSRVRLLKVDIEGSEIAVVNHLMDTGAIELVDLTVVETHERQLPHLLMATDALRKRIQREGFETRIRLDWY